MNREQTVELITSIDNAFPGRLKMEESTVETWYRYMKNQDYDKVMERLDAYTIENKFPPTVADLYEKYRPEREKGYGNKIERWKEEASGPPQRRS